jgi:hypothetical protein
LLVLEEVIGISEGVSAEMVSRYNELIDLIKPTYANVGLFLVTVDEETFEGTSIEDSYQDIDIDLLAVPLEEIPLYSTLDVYLFKSEPGGNSSLTPDTSGLPGTLASLAYRTFHVALEYAEPPS